MLQVSGLSKAQLKFLGKENDKERTARVAAEALNAVQAIVTNPIALMIGGFILIDWAEAHYWDPCCRTDSILGPAAANTLRAGLVGGFTLGAVGDSGLLK